jgi:hypothetical protein
VRWWREMVAIHRFGGVSFHEKSAKLGCAGMWSELALKDRMLRKCEQ